MAITKMSDWGAVGESVLSLLSLHSSHPRTLNCPTVNVRLEAPLASMIMRLP
jgi:hypothetical protein